jgi:hypothetical protein
VSRPDAVSAFETGVRGCEAPSPRFSVQPVLGRLELHLNTYLEVLAMELAAHQKADPAKRVPFSESPRVLTWAE